MLALILGTVLAVFLSGIIFKSLSVIFKILVNIFVGVVTLYIFNFIFTGFGMEIIINPLTSFLVGFFGLPAVIAILLFNVFM